MTVEQLKFRLENLIHQGKKDSVVFISVEKDIATPISEIVEKEVANLNLIILRF